MPKQRHTPPANAPFVAARRAISRRRFLRGAGILLSLPLLDAMQPAFAAATEGAAATPGGKPRRMLGICNNLGVLPDHFFPTESGRDYPLSPYLEILKEHRNDFTVFSGVSHPDVDGGHPADNCFLTAAPHPGRGSFRNTISLDQYHRRTDRAPDALPVVDSGCQCAARPAEFVLDQFGRADSVRGKAVGGVWPAFPGRDQGRDGEPGAPTRSGRKHPRRRGGPGEGFGAQRWRA